jgi:hypothetical protein
LEPKKPYEIIAGRFQISNESAKFFLGKVQKSFKKKKPPLELIMDCMQGRKFKSLPTPYEVAALMKELGIWDQALVSEPPVIQDDPDIY